MALLLSVVNFPQNLSEMRKTAIVTGASRGIGKATCERFASKKCNVIATARSEQPKFHQKHSGYITYFSTDLTNNLQIEAMVENIKQDYSEIDILINNVGALINKPFNRLTFDDWDYLFRANVLSTVGLTKAIIPLMNEGGHIVNISSMGGFQGSEKFSGLSAYSSVKSAVSTLSECLAVELAEQKITVNALCIGSVQTSMFEKAFPGLQAGVSAEEMGNYIADFALNGSDFYNGKILPVAMDL